LFTLFDCILFFFSKLSLVSSFVSKFALNNFYLP